MYKVVAKFLDLEDNKREYKVGETFPREGVEVSERRLAILSTDQNAAKKVLIEKLEEGEEDVFPKHTGGGYYELSNGEKVKGKEAAEKAEDELKVD
ncbi:hypothetical protein A499_06415 [Niallia nealsonii AAU1]|nr:hypothetical protein A499_06415 [Niallia nealsonii AAU1]